MYAHIAFFLHLYRFFCLCEYWRVFWCATRVFLWYSSWMVYLKTHTSAVLPLLKLMLFAHAFYRRDVAKFECWSTFRCRSIDVKSLLYFRVIIYGNGGKKWIEAFLPKWEWFHWWNSVSDITKCNEKFHWRLFFYNSTNSSNFKISETMKRKKMSCQVNKCVTNNSSPLIPIYWWHNTKFTV